MIRATLLALLATTPFALADPYYPSAGDQVTPSATGISLLAYDGSAGIDLPFGAPFHQVMYTLYTAIPAQPEIWLQSECPLGPVITAEVGNDLSLVFQDDRLIGWSFLPGTELTTPEGLALGLARGALETMPGVAFFDSTLGVEFEAGGVFGLLSEDGQSVGYLWGGGVCIFR